MSLLLLLIMSFLSGSLMKLADDLTDKNLRIPRSLAVPFGITYGSLMGYLIILDADASVLFGGIVLGCLITGKINSIAHYFGLASILIMLFLYGIKLPPLVLLTSALAALDEMGDALHGFYFIFEYRMILKLGTLMLVILNILGLNAIIILLAFDGAYIITEYVTSRLS